MDFASGNGKLFIAHRSIDPIYISYSVDGSCGEVAIGWDTTVVKLYERDLSGADDGLDPNENPATLTNAHRYNLLNQGWTDQYIQDYFDEVGTYPSNNESWQLGKYIDSSSGKELWSVEELKKSSIGTANTPRGHFIRNLFDTCDIDANATVQNNVNNFTMEDCNVLVIRYTSPHGLVDGNAITLDSNLYEQEYDDPLNPGARLTQLASLDGTYNVGAATGDIATIRDAYTVEIPIGITIAGANSVCTLVNEGTVTSADIDPGLPSSDCCTEDSRPEVNGIFAGRVWYSGIASERLGNRVYFSQVLLTDTQIGRMYQEYDPTAEEFSELIKTDGGFIEIPEMGGYGQ